MEHHKARNWGPTYTTWRGRSPDFPLSPDTVTITFTYLHDKTKRESLIQLKKLKQNGREIDFKVPNDTNYKTEPMKPAEPEPAAYVP